MIIGDYEQKAFYKRYNVHVVGNRLAVYLKLPVRFIMLNMLKYMVKPEELYIFSCGKRPRPKAETFSTAEYVKLRGF